MLKYEIIINPKLLKKIEKDIWNEDHVPALLKIGKTRLNIGLSYRGNVIRKKQKKSYHIIFQKPFLYEGAHEIHLNAEFEDISLSRNKLSLDFFNRIGVPAPSSKHVLLYINGSCKGIYLELESFDQYFLQRRKLPLGPIIYATNYFANFSLLSPEKKLKTDLLDGYTLKYGRKIDLEKLEEFIIMINSLNNEEFEDNIVQFLNVDQYLKWLACVVCTQNFDGFIHNYALYLNGKSSTFEITPWDYDGTWGRDLHGRTLEHDFVPITGYNTLSARILHIPYFRERYKDILQTLLNHDFTPDVQLEIIEDIFTKLTPFLHLDPYIQTSEYDLDSEKRYILDFIQKRNAYLIEQLKEL